MSFYFDEKLADKLMSKINLRDISSRAKQWDHPMKGLLKYANALSKHEKNILKVPKKERELFCVSLVALALQNDTRLDWWTNIPVTDPPDGLVMTLGEEKSGMLKGYMREIEVVEHRSSPEQLFNIIQNKMTEKSYAPDTTLVCLALSPAVYDLFSLAENLKKVSSPIKHIFVVFAGIALSDHSPTSEQLHFNFTMVQLLPVFNQTTFDLLQCLRDFDERYKQGQESRLIENNQVYYATVNPIYTKRETESTVPLE